MTEEEMQKDCDDTWEEYKDWTPPTDGHGEGLGPLVFGMFCLLCAYVVFAVVFVLLK